jgi:hypothetical protein
MLRQNKIALLVMEWVIFSVKVVSVPLVKAGKL